MMNVRRVDTSYVTGRLMIKHLSKVYSREKNHNNLKCESEKLMCNNALQEKIL